MKLLFRQRFFSWFDSYDIYDEQGRTLYEVRGQLSWGHCLKIYDAGGQELGMVKERVLTLLPRFTLYRGGQAWGTLQKEFTFLRPRYHIAENGWHIEGNFLAWDYTVQDGAGREIAAVSKQLLRWTDTYVIDVVPGGDALGVLMFVLAMDAEKCSRGNG